MVRMGRTGRGRHESKKPLAWHHDQPGLDASYSTNRPPFHDGLPGRRERPAGTRSGATGFGPPPSRRLIREPGDLPCVPGASLFWDIGSAASTEVVMAQDEFSACRRPVSGFSDMLPILAIAWERA